MLCAPSVPRLGRGPKAVEASSRAECMGGASSPFPRASSPRRRARPGARNWGAGCAAFLRGTPPAPSSGEA
eukprot:12510880-Alexandrium_andersonii.AAC.1